MATVDLLPPPEHDDGFDARVTQVPPDVAARSTWKPKCPVALEDLRFIMLPFWGFDGRPHTGELIVNRAVAGDIVQVFRRLYRIRFPIEDMHVTSERELDAPPTGDGNNTSGFVCRPSRSSITWSQHAYGLAVDVNPFHNPYIKGNVVLPELASAYKNRAWKRPGMILAGDEVTGAFSGIGWIWGGTWQSSKDYMHFSSTGR